MLSPYRNSRYSDIHGYSVLICKRALIKSLEQGYSINIRKQLSGYTSLNAAEVRMNITDGPQAPEIEKYN